jgi:hypothetical protein
MFESYKTTPNLQKQPTYASSTVPNDSALSTGDFGSPSANRRSASRVTFAQNLNAPASPPAAARLSDLALSDRAQPADDRGIASGTPSSPREIDCDELTLAALAPATDWPRTEADFTDHWIELASRRFEQHLRDAGVALTPSQRQHERRRFLESVRAEARELWRAGPAGAPGSPPDDDAEPYALTLSALSAAVA